MENFEEDLHPHKKRMSLAQKLKFISSNITIEPILFSYIVLFRIMSIAMQNFSLEKACRVNLHLAESVCDAMTVRNTSGYNKTDEIAVQKLVATSYLFKNIVEGVLPLIWLPFLGSWADRYNKRLFCVLLPVTGDIACAVGHLLCTFFFYQLPLEVNVLVEAVSVALTGSMNVLQLGAYSLICAMSSLETRTLRVGSIHMILMIGIAIGNSLSGILYQAISFYGIFSLNLVVQVSCIIYGIFFVHESKIGCQKRKKGILKDIFDIKCMLRSYKGLFESGGKQKRKEACLMMVLILLVVSPLVAKINLIYLYTRFKFDWNEVDISIFLTYSLLIHCTGTVVALELFSRRWKLDDATLGVIASVSRICGTLACAFAPTALLFYIGTFITFFEHVCHISVRSISSKIVPENELGKMYSLFSLVESVAFLACVPIYTALYKETIAVFPGAFFLLTTLCTSMAIAIYIWFYVHRMPIKTSEAAAEKEKQRLTN